MTTCGRTNLKSHLAVFELLCLVLIWAMFGFSYAATNAPLNYCATNNKQFNISYVYITDVVDGADVCQEGGCKFRGGHTYTAVGEGCGGNPGEVITSMAFQLYANGDILIPILGTPLVSKLILLTGDLCTDMRPINETISNAGTPIGHCPAVAPACAKFQVLIHAPFVPVPIPSDYLWFGAQVYGRMWLNTGPGNIGAESEAAICGHLPILYSPIG